MTSPNVSSNTCSGASAKSPVSCMNLPVAARANARLRFASNTKTVTAIPPEAAVSLLEETLNSGKKINAAGIVGPGDPLTAFEASYSALAMIRTRYPDLAIYLDTLGFNGGKYAEKLAELNISHITVLVDAVDPGVAENIYSWIRPSTKTVPLPEASKLLIEEQARSIKAFKKAGITVKINTTVYPENIDHIEEIARTMKEYGADMMSVIPFIPEEESNFSAVSDELLKTARTLAAKHMELMEPWVNCGAEVEVPPSSTLPRPTRERPNVAVASSSGMDIDLHLGQAHQLLIYGPREDGLNCLLETRPAPEPGSGSVRWETMAETLSDCFALLTSSAGEKPKKFSPQKVSE